MHGNTVSHGLNDTFHIHNNGSSNSNSNSENQRKNPKKNTRYRKNHPSKGMTPKHNQCHVKYYARQLLVIVVVAAANECICVRCETIERSKLRVYRQSVIYLPLLCRSFVEYVHLFRQSDWLSLDSYTGLAWLCDRCAVRLSISQIVYRNKKIYNKKFVWKPSKQLTHDKTSMETICMNFVLLVIKSFFRKTTKFKTLFSHTRTHTLHWKYFCRFHIFHMCNSMSSSLFFLFVLFG